jgi:Ca2+-binding EF-hand superfamily protein
MKKFLIATAALMAGTAALAQTAQTAPAAPAPPPEPMMHSMGDKTMTRDEVVAMVRDHFGRLDADHDGSITTDEVTKGHEQMAEHFKTMRMEHGEGGGDHVMMREGPMGDPNAVFDRLDTNKDGSISRDEFAKAHEQRIEKRIEIREQHKEAAKDGKMADWHSMRMHRMGDMGPGHMLVMADTDHDGKVTLAEAEALALQHFDQMDANHDGQVTPEERRAGRPMIIKKVIEEKKTNG